MRLLASGASPLPPAVLEQVQTAVGITIHEGYGLTETAPVVTSTLASPGRQAGLDRPADARRRGAAASTRAAPTAVDDDAGRALGPRREPVLGLLAGRQRAARTPDGWWATGDVAYADEDGDLFLVDRRKELVIVSGFNVYPREVEDALAEHPDVAEVAVIAVPHPLHRRGGEGVRGARERVPPCGRGRHRARAPTRLARFKRPTIVTLVAALPHSATGKVAKGRLRAREGERAEVTGGGGAPGRP